VFRGDVGECQFSVGNRYEGFGGSRAVCDVSVVLVTMVSVARLKRLVQGVTLVAVATYTAIVLYQNMSTAASSPRPQVNSAFLVVALWVTRPQVNSTFTVVALWVTRPQVNSAFLVMALWVTRPQVNSAFTVVALWVTRPQVNSAFLVVALWVTRPQVNSAFLVVTTPDRLA
jgi:hypothetical protein